MSPTHRADGPADETGAAALDAPATDALTDEAPATEIPKIRIAISAAVIIIL